MELYKDRPMDEKEVKAEGAAEEPVAQNTLTATADQWSVWLTFSLTIFLPHTKHSHAFSV